jgi:hypothetical protein
MPATTIIDLVNISDPNALKAVLEEQGLSEASKADRIASTTRRAITERMDEDPSFYQRFSELLEETSRAYRALKFGSQRRRADTIPTTTRQCASCQEPPANKHLIVPHRRRCQGSTNTGRASRVISIPACCNESISIWGSSRR